MSFLFHGFDFFCVHLWKKYKRWTNICNGGYRSNAEVSNFLLKLVHLYGWWHFEVHWERLWNCPNMFFHKVSYNKDINSLIWVVDHFPLRSLIDCTNLGWNKLANVMNIFYFKAPPLIISKLAFFMFSTHHSDTQL